MPVKTLIKANERALLCGGKKIQNWSECGAGVYRAKLLPEMPVDFRMITVNGNLHKRARLPIEGRLPLLPFKKLAKMTIMRYIISNGVIF